ncbi:glycoside hydrolase family 65 protein [Cohnella sp. GCM10020058]|uniref:glycoside hydrolase family 65 protein n=1 Tax=Cohnella sp. GCM10020058 TaxID=3317330 RepID=UPI003644B3D6
MAAYFFHEALNRLLSEDDWLIVQSAYDAKSNLKHETLFTLTNGYMGTRGAFEQGAVPEMPGNYLAGVFNKGDGPVRELVNLPRWHGISVFANRNALRYAEEASPLNAQTCEVIRFCRILDMKQGILISESVYRDSAGHETAVGACRFVSRDDVHRAGIRLLVTPLNHEGVFGIESYLDGAAVNWKTNPKFRAKHYNIVAAEGTDSEQLYLEAVTKDEAIHIGMGSAIHGLSRFGQQTPLPTIYHKFSNDGGQCAEYVEFRIGRQETVQLDKLVATYHSLELNEDRLRDAVHRNLAQYRSEGWTEELRKHTDRYAEMWKEADIQIAGSEEDNRLVRFNLFHLMSTAYSGSPAVSIAAKGLHGEGYWGHVFWDTEIFMLPFFMYTFPDLAKSLLKYRYEKLDGARENARVAGYAGAKFPWQSAAGGQEEIPPFSYDEYGAPQPLWMGKIEDHVTADIAYAVCQYVSVVDDPAFMLEYGLELLIETARFWQSRVAFDAERGQYVILNVIGPDEFHEHVDNNAYTNGMAAHNLVQAADRLTDYQARFPAEVSGLLARLAWRPDDIAEWRQIAALMYIPRDEEQLLIEQFDGYFQKRDYQFTAFDDHGMPVYTGNPQLAELAQTKIIKQADTVMLLLLLRGFADPAAIKANYEYYEKRTWHQSSLSMGMSALMAQRLGDTEKAYDLWLRTAKTDLMDRHGNAGLGLHAAATGAVWQGLIFGFGGVQPDESSGMLEIAPSLPRAWKSLSFTVQWRGYRLTVEAEPEQLHITLPEIGEEAFQVKIWGQAYAWSAEKSGERIAVPKHREAAVHG